MCISVLIVIKKRFNKIFSYIPQFFGFVHLYLLFYISSEAKERDLIPLYFWTIYYIATLCFYIVVNKVSLKWILKLQLGKREFNFPEFHNQLSHLEPESDNKEDVEKILNDIEKKHIIAEYQENSEILSKFLINKKKFVKEGIIEILIEDYKK